jgi:hypothetical protein
MYGNVYSNLRSRGAWTLWLLITISHPAPLKIYTTYAVKHVVQLLHTFLVLVERRG